MITMAKGMGNGIPLGGVTCTKEIAESMREKVHFNTYGGNPFDGRRPRGGGNHRTQQLHAQRQVQVTSGPPASISWFATTRSSANMRQGPHAPASRSYKDKESKEVAPQHVQRAMELCKDRDYSSARGGMAANTIRIKPPLCITNADQ